MLSEVDFPCASHERISFRSHRYVLSLPIRKCRVLNGALVVEFTGDVTEYTKVVEDVLAQAEKLAEQLHCGNDVVHFRAKTLSYSAALWLLSADS